MKYLLILAIIFPLFSIAQVQYLIKGEVQELVENEYVYLLFEDFRRDSTRVKNGKFEFSGNIKAPVLVQLGIYATDAQLKGVPPLLDKYRSFYLSAPSIYINGKDLNNAKVEADKLNSIYSKYWRETDSFRATADQMKSAYFEKMKNGSLTNEQAVRHQELFEEFIVKLTDFDVSFLENNEPSLFSADLIERYLNQYNVFALTQIFNKIPAADIDSLKRGKILKAISRYEKLAIGSIAPAFTLSDTAGNAVSLASFRGKVILLDFWASWCIPCRKENPRYLEIYDKYKDQNFEIVAVSLNRANEKEVWLKAINEDNISVWNHLSDLQGYKSPIYQLYEVKGLPQSYLINEKGEIIGHNLKGIDLERKLAQILK